MGDGGQKRGRQRQTDRQTETHTERQREIERGKKQRGEEVQTVNGRRRAKQMERDVGRARGRGGRDKGGRGRGKRGRGGRRDSQTSGESREFGPRWFPCVRKSPLCVPQGLSRFHKVAFKTKALVLLIDIALI